MPELITIPNSVFEYSADYQRPVIALWLDRAKIIQAVFDSLAPWNAKAEDIEGRNEGKPVDQGFAIRLPEKRATIFFGPVRYKITLDGADWAQVQDIVRVIDTSRTALLESSQSTIEVQRTVVALHLQPKTMRFSDILAPFWPEALFKLGRGPIRTGAVILKWENSTITIDGSGSLANGVFLKLAHDFAANVSYDEIAEVLRRDELAAFAALGVEEDRA